MDAAEHDEPRNLKYWLTKTGHVVSCPASADELSTARAAAHKKLEADKADWAMRSCWVCNSAHTHFLRDRKDGFLFGCIMGCGRFYYNGIDITEYDQAATDKAKP